MIHVPYRPRVFVLGAGFSALAGLPLGADLLPGIKAEAQYLAGPDNALEHSLSAYLRYRRDISGALDKEFDLERFVEYVDHKHFLHLREADRDSDPYADHRLVRQATALSILRRTPSAESLPEAYHLFAKGLRPGDVILTFNYDLIVESLLAWHNLRYQRYPFDYGDEHKRRDEPSCLSSNPTPPILVMKLHGSVDWVDEHEFSATVRWIADQYDERDAYEYALDYNPLGSHPSELLVDSGEGPEDPLGSIRVLLEPIEYLESRRASSQFCHSPMILTPSYAKLVYGTRLAPLWRVFSDLSYYISGLAFIGYSIPDGDSHARQAIHDLVSGYEDVMLDPENYGLHEAVDPTSDEWLYIDESETISPIKVVNLAQSPQEKANLREAYRFFSAHSTDFIDDGFNAMTAKAVVDPQPVCVCRNCT